MGGGAGALLGACGPFIDVPDAVFCPFVLEIFYLGITTGTTATTYDPAGNVSRLQMAAFLSRTVDGVLKRGSRRAALDQFWTTQNASVLGTVSLGGSPNTLQSDGADIWVSNSGSVSRVRASDGKILDTWTGATNAFCVLTAMGRVVVTGNTNLGLLYVLDPTQPAGAVSVAGSGLTPFTSGIAFDGARVWTANQGGGGFGGAVLIFTPGPMLPWTVTTVTTGFSKPFGALYDGANVWVTDSTANRLFELDAGGAILQTVTVGLTPQLPVFDGANIWVPNGNSASVTVVRASNGVVLATLTGNGLSVPGQAAFDGQRVLVANEAGGVSLWKAADLSPLGGFSTGAASPVGACSDGVSFWITLPSAGQIARF